MNYEFYFDIFEKLGFHSTKAGNTLKHQEEIPSIYFNYHKTNDFASFVIYKKDRNLFPDSFWNVILAQKTKDDKDNLLTIVPKKGKEFEAFKSLVVKKFSPTSGKSLEVNLKKCESGKFVIPSGKYIFRNMDECWRDKKGKGIPTIHLLKNGEWERVDRDSGTVVAPTKHGISKKLEAKTVARAVARQLGLQALEKNANSRSWINHIVNSKNEIAKQGLTEQEVKFREQKSKTYERKPETKIAMIKKYGLKCYVCGFDFKETYGDLGLNFIHCHHEYPVCEVPESGNVDEVKPLCPNCHAMAHKTLNENGEPVKGLTGVEELKEIIKLNKN